MGKFLKIRHIVYSESIIKFQCAYHTTAGKKNCMHCAFYINSFFVYAFNMVYFIQVDVTPPILIFKRKPNRSQSKVNITWDTNEETNGLCQVKGPSSFYRSVVCDKVWSEDYLPEGEFILNVTVYDQSLNMAGPFQHKWYNSKSQL